MSPSDEISVIVTKLSDQFTFFLVGFCYEKEKLTGAQNVIISTSCLLTANGTFGVKVIQYALQLRFFF